MIEVLINSKGYKILEIILHSNWMTKEGQVRVLSANKLIVHRVNKTLVSTELLQGIEQHSVSAFIQHLLDQVKKTWIIKKFQVLRFWLKINYLMGQKVKIPELPAKVQRNKLQRRLVLRNLKAKFLTLKRNKIKSTSWSYKILQMFVEVLLAEQAPYLIMVTT